MFRVNNKDNRTTPLAAWKDYLGNSEFHLTGIQVVSCNKDMKF